MLKYDPHVWKATLFAVRGTMLRVIAVRALYVTAFAAALTAIHAFYFPLAFKGMATAHGMVSTALGLLLVFRTNASYDRWWEGRKLWGSIVNTCRNLARQASVHLAQEPSRVDDVLRLTRAFPPAAMHLLRGKQWTDEELFGPADRTRGLAHSHPPLAICTRMTEVLHGALRDKQVSDIVFASLDADVHQLVDCIGACERIHKTPPPFAYVVHLRRALIIYCASMPLALLESFGWATIPVVFIVSYMLLGIEELGVEIEDPFGLDPNDLPLQQISQNIDKNVRAFERNA